MISTESLTDVTTCVSWGGCAPDNTCIHCDDWTIQQFSLKGTYCDHVVQLKQNSVVWSELIYIYIYFHIRVWKGKSTVYKMPAHPWDVCEFIKS